MSIVFRLTYKTLSNTYYFLPGHTSLSQQVIDKKNSQTNNSKNIKIREGIFNRHFVLQMIRLSSMKELSSHYSLDMDWFPLFYRSHILSFHQPFIILDHAYTDIYESSSSKPYSIHFAWSYL